MDIPFKRSVDPSFDDDAAQDSKRARLDVQTILSQPSPFRGFVSASEFEKEAGYSSSAPTIIECPKYSDDVQNDLKMPESESNREERAGIHDTLTNDEPLSIPSEMTALPPSSAIHSNDSSQGVASTHHLLLSSPEAQSCAEHPQISATEQETSISRVTVATTQPDGNDQIVSQIHSSFDDPLSRANENEAYIGAGGEGLGDEGRLVEEDRVGALKAQEHPAPTLSDSENPDHASRSIDVSQLFSMFQQSSTILDTSMSFPKSDDYPPSSPEMRMETLSSPVYSPVRPTVHPLPMSDPMVLSDDCVLPRIRGRKSASAFDVAQEPTVTTPGTVDKPYEEVPTYEASTNLTRAAPNHPTAASLHRSKKKITRPFRSPLLLKRTNSKEASGSREHKPKVITPSVRKTMVGKIKASGSAGVRAAFKSPLRAENVPTSGLNQIQLLSHAQSVKGSEIYEIDRRLQLLQRAVKLKVSGEDDELEELVVKWRGVAQSVAWELWEIVKEGNVSDAPDSYAPTSGETAFGSRDASFMRDDGFDKNWGWAEKEGGTDEQSLEDAAKAPPEEEEDDQDKYPERTMGTMLRELGIADETLGWNEDEGDFVQA